MIIHIIRTIIAFSLTLCMPLNAAEPLTEELIDRWIDSQKAFNQWGETNQQALLDYEATTEGPDNPLIISAEEMLQPLKRTGLAGSATILVEKFGFGSLESWAEVTLRITRAAAAIQVETQQGSLDTSKLEALKASGKLSEQQKAVVSRAIKQNNAMLEYLEKQVSSTDKIAVKPHLSKLKALFDLN